MAAEASFRAMGSDAQVIIVGGPSGLIETAQRRIDDLEQRWSRFRDDSEVSELNRRAGTPVRVSWETVHLVARAVEAWRLSGGAFDPTLLGAIIRAGYDRSFDELGPAPPPGVSPLRPGADRIEICRDTVYLPAGTGFDPGGIGKGLAADLVTAELIALGAEGVCVNLGGDVRVTGTGPGPAGTAWTIGVEHPSSGEPIARVGLSDGAVATSTTLRRQWRTDNQARHHLIDPQTGLPSETDINLASVVSAQAWAAEVLAKAVLLRGSAHPFDILGGTGAQGLIVDEAGRLQITPGFADFVGPARSSMFAAPVFSPYCSTMH